MLLMAIKENAGWVLSQWGLTYSVGWEQICKAVYFMFDYYDNTEILVDDKLIDLSSKENTAHNHETVHQMGCCDGGAIEKLELLPITPERVG